MEGGSTASLMALDLVCHRLFLVQVPAQAQGPLLYLSLLRSHSFPSPHTSSAMNVPSISLGLWGGPGPRTQLPKATLIPPSLFFHTPHYLAGFRPLDMHLRPHIQASRQPPKAGGRAKESPPKPQSDLQEESFCGNHWPLSLNIQNAPVLPGPQSPPTPNSPCQGSLCSLNSHFLPFPSEAGAAALGYTSASSPYPERDPRDSFLTRP